MNAFALFATLIMCGLHGFLAYADVQKGHILRAVILIAGCFVYGFLFGLGVYFTSIGQY